MTAPGPVVSVTETDPTHGCTVCGSNDTVLLHPHHGRLCSDDMTLPVGPFRADLAADIVDLGRADRAFAYLADWLTREIDIRFTALQRALYPIESLSVGRLTSGVITAAVVIRRPKCHCGRSINTPGALECAECF